MIAWLRRYVSADRNLTEAVGRESLIEAISRSRTDCGAYHASVMCVIPSCVSRLEPTSDCA